MPTKTISIMEDAYEILSRNKMKNESFSDVIRKIASKKDISKFIGAWQMNDKEANEMKKAILDLRTKGKRSLLRKVKGT